MLSPLGPPREALNLWVVIGLLKQIMSDTVAQTVTTVLMQKYTNIC